MEKIKVLHCLHSLSWGGLEIYSIELIKKLNENGVNQHAVLCAPESRVYEELRKTNISLYTLSKPIVSKLAQAHQIRKLIRSHGYSILHSHSRLDMWACSLALVGLHRARHIYNLYMNAKPKRDLFHRWLFSRVHALCSSSEIILQDVRQNFPVPENRLHLIRYGQEPFTSSIETRQKIRNLHGALDQQIVFATLCRMDPGKGVRELIEALHFLTEEERNQLQIWLVGDPTIIGKTANGHPLYEGPSVELNKWIETEVLPSKLGKHIRRIPFQKEYSAYLNALDVFVLASYHETYSLSVLDAMLMGKPVIATNRGGSIEQVGPNTRGLLVEPRDANAIATALRYYLQNQSQILDQGHQAKSWALAHHSWNKTIRDFTDLYLRLCLDLK